MIDYVLSLKESCIIIQGIRAGESTARAAMEEECMYFKSYFQPNKKGRTENYRSKDVKEWCSQFDASVLRPIFKWSAQQVIDCILDAGQKPNPLYYRGFSRVGCFPCIMCRHKEIELIAKNDPEMCQRLIQAEKNVGHSFFPPLYIPQRFCKNKQYPYVEEVLEYVKEHTPDMFEPESGYACMSLFHGLCE